jgi:hypothetical protein
MKTLFLLWGSFLVTLACGLAQTATLTATANTLSAQGGTIELTASIVYPADTTTNPTTALGFKINLPPGWSLSSTAGANVPTIGPAPGTTGALDYAYSDFPANQATFTATVAYPADLFSDQTITAIAIYRTPLAQVAVTPLVFTPAPLAPTFASTGGTTFVVGQANSFPIRARGYPASVYSVEVGTLPAGITLNGATGILSGTPAGGVVGQHSFTLKAANGVAPDVTQVFTLTIDWPPNTTIFAGTELSGRKFGDADFAVSATNNRGLLVDYDSSDPLVATVGASVMNAGSSTATVHIVGAGTTVITAKQPGATGISPAPDVPRTLTVAKATATIALSGLTATYTGSAHAVAAFTSPPGLGVIVSYAGSSVPPSAVGSYAVVATINSPNYLGTQTGTLVISASTLPPGGGGGGGGGVILPPIGGGGGGGGVFFGAAPSIRTQPASQTAAEGGTATFTVVTEGSNLIFLWRRNGVPIAGASGSTLTLTSVNSGHAGTYSVIISNSSGSVFSNEATLSITPQEPPVIASQPVDRTVVSGSSMVFSVGVTGTAPFTYQWRKSGSDIPGATQSTLTLANVTLASAGSYSVQVSNANGSTTSAAATLNVTPAGYGGAYFGAFGGNGGSFAFFVRSDGTGVFIGYAKDGRVAIIARDVIVDANGQFAGNAPVSQMGATSIGTPPVAALANHYQVSGAFDENRRLSGTVSELGLAFAAPASTEAGVSAPFAGFYEAGSGGSSAWSYSIIGSGGQAFVLTTSGSAVDAGMGQVTAGGQLEITTDANARISGTVESNTSVISVQVTSAPGTTITFAGANNDARRDIEKLVNISTRSQTGTATSTLIAGFVVAGNAPKPVLVRAIGPTLGTVFNVTGALTAARLEIFRGQTSVAVGTDWSAAPNAADIIGTAARVGAFTLPTSSRDAALLVTLEPGAYTAVVTGQGTASGVSLIEVYDATNGPIPRDQRIVNIATRAMAGTGDEALIAGFVITGAVPKRLLIRGVGPALAPFGVTGVLTRPQLTVTAGSSIIAQNSGWSSSADAAAIAAASAQVGAFSLAAGSQDAAVIVNLQPGAYTAQISGVGGTTGVALVEVYEIP